MMKKILLSGFGALLLAFGGVAHSAVIGLFDACLNVDGALSSEVGTCGAADTWDDFDDMTGLGSVSVTVTGAGAHHVGLFVDHEIDEATNTFFNEVGSTTGAPAAGQSWEIDEPGWVDGDIYLNFENASLDNGIGTSIFGDTVFPDDVSMALAWDFTLAAGETALARFFVGESLPNDVPSFFLTHNDPDSRASIYFWSDLTIRGGGDVPEPGTLLLLGAGLLGMGLNRRRKLI